MGSILFWKILGNKLDPDSSQNNFQSILFGQRHGSIKMVRPVWGIIMSPSDLYSCFYRKLTYGYQISGIFIGSPDTGYQLMYLHYQIRSMMNTSSNKNFPSTSAAIKNRLTAELTSRYSGTGTGPKYKRNSPLLCSECFRIIVTQRKFSVLLMFSF